MKFLRPISVFLCLAAAAGAQTPVITEFGGGQLTFTNVTTNLEYRLQWTTSAGSTNEFFDNIEYIAPTGVNVTVPLPLRFQVGTTNALSNNIFRAHEHPFGIPRGTNAKATVEWSENYSGPWASTWNAALEVTPTGTVANAPTPHYFRVTWINCPSNFCGCAQWTDATDPAANHTVEYSGFAYTSKCFKVRVGQTVTFSNRTPTSFFGNPLRPGCQDHENGITNVDAGSVAFFIFSEPGYFNYFCQGFGNGTGLTADAAGMAGNIWVIP
jgi:plastocyanin